MTPPDRPPITPELVARFAAYYQVHPTWGSLHIALDDGNVRDTHIDFCAEWAERTGDDEGLELARLLRTMSRTQRARVGRLAERRDQVVAQSRARTAPASPSVAPS